MKTPNNSREAPGLKYRIQDIKYGVLDAIAAIIGRKNLERLEKGAYWVGDHKFALTALALVLFGADQGARTYNSQRFIRDDGERAIVAAYNAAAFNMDAKSFFGVVYQNGQVSLSNLELPGTQNNDYNHNGHKIYTTPTHFVIQGANLVYAGDRDVTLPYGNHDTIGHEHVYQLVNPDDPGQRVSIYAPATDSVLTQPQLDAMMQQGVNVEIGAQPVMDSQGGSVKVGDTSQVTLSLHFSQTPPPPHDTVLPEIPFVGSN